MHRYLIAFALLLISSCSLDDTYESELEQVEGGRYYYKLSKLSDSELATYASRGKYLTNSVAACAVCHLDKKGVNLSGGLVIKDEAGLVEVPNITSDKETGIGLWSSWDLVRAIRFSIGQDGRLMGVGAHEGYRWMSEKDILSIITYLKSTSPIKNSSDKRELSWSGSKNYLLFSKHKEFPGVVPEIPASESVAYGAYLYDNVASCETCHGGSGKLGVAKGDIDKTGFRIGNFPITGPRIQGDDSILKEWTEGNLTNYLSNVHKNKSRYSCPTFVYKRMSSSDRSALVLYILSQVQKGEKQEG